MLLVFLALIAIALFFLVYIATTISGMFDPRFLGVATIAGCSLIIIILFNNFGLIDSLVKITKPKTEPSEADKRELEYITAIVRGYPRENFFLVKGAIWQLIKRIIAIKPESLDQIHFNVQIAFFLKGQIELIIEKNKKSPLQEIKKLLEDADVDEAGDDFGTNQYLAELQNKVLEICSGLIIEAAQIEYKDVCTTHTPLLASGYLDNLNRVEIFRILDLKSKLLARTKNFEVIQG